MRSIIDIEGVEKVYEMRGGEVRALRGVDLSIRAGEYVSIMGPSGSGKTTLFNMIGGLDQPTEGEIIVKGRKITWHSASEP